MTSGKDFQIGAMSGISAYQQAQMTRAQEKLRAAQAPSNGENVSDKLQGKESVGEVKKAAQQFEALLLQQMMKASQTISRANTVERSWPSNLKLSSW